MQEDNKPQPAPPQQAEETAPPNQEPLPESNVNSQPTPQDQQPPDFDNRQTTKHSSSANHIIPIILSIILLVFLAVVAILSENAG
ncbi:MAG TPA: hypothetical protein VFK11_04035 [Candidatus Saccharimonadales bacterium]|nr:hypothetical protein [Candidatus Saccharimonadales bacterium]